MDKLVASWLVALVLGVAATLLVVLESSSKDNMFAWESEVLYQLEQTAKRGAVPNYDRREWWARNLIFRDAQRREVNFNPFGRDAVENHNQLGSDTKFRDWSEVCELDSDFDGFTNGAELGDPCCIYNISQAKGGSKGQVAWTWRTTHPGGDTTSGPGEHVQAMLNKLDCSTVKIAGVYPSHDKEFDEFFFHINPEHVETSLITSLSRLAMLLVLFASLSCWVWMTSLWERQGTSRSVIFGTFVLAYAHNDLSSAFVHSFFDNCNQKHPLIGEGCKGTQYHHFSPRSQSLEPMVNWFGNPIATAPAVLAMVLYGFLGSKFPFPRWCNYLLFWLGCTAPLSYFFHQAAHTPEEDRGWFLILLQNLNIALSPELHKQHHRMPNGTWSVMAGWMDWVPNWIYNGGMGLSTDSPRTTIMVVYALVLLPWYAWLGHSTVKELADRKQGRASSEQSGFLLPMKAE